MNIEKAREYFSAYFEGTLDRGLKQSFERQLASDEQLAAEYRAFEQTMTELGLLPDLPIEIPTDLHERISTRLDRYSWEQKQKASSTPFGWIRPLLIGIGVVAVGGLVILQATGRFDSGQPAVQASFVTPSNRVGALGVKAIARGVSIDLSTVQGERLVVRNEKGDELQRLELATSRTLQPITNSGQSVNLVVLQVDSQRPIWIAIPGTERPKATGAGSLKEFARAIAGQYEIPVVLAVADPLRSTNWTLEADRAVNAVYPVTQSLGLKSELKGESDAVLWVQED